MDKEFSFCQVRSGCWGRIVFLLQFYGLIIYPSLMSRSKETHDLLTGNSRSSLAPPRAVRQESLARSFSTTISCLPTWLACLSWFLSESWTLPHQLCKAAINSPFNCIEPKPLSLSDNWQVLLRMLRVSLSFLKSEDPRCPKPPSRVSFSYLLMCRNP